MFRTFAFRSTQLNGDEPPTEFQIFAAGDNPGTGKPGNAVFDQAAAREVMATYQREGVDIMIDLEHLSINRESRSYDPDARGWAKLAVKADGSLWAVDVRWTPEGEQRLRDRKQRYVSPFFGHSKPDASGAVRVRRIVNVALCSMPATHDAQPLIAATQGMPLMDPELVKKALDALESGDAAGALEILKSLIASAASGGAPPAAEPPPDATASAEPPPDPEKDEAMAAASRLTALTAASSASDALEIVETWRKDHVELAAERDRLARERTALESGERRTLVAALVKVGAETPATAWSDASATAPCARLVAEPIADLRKRVAALVAVRAAVPPAPPRIPAVPAGSPELTEQQAAFCKQYGCEPAVFMSLRNRDARS